MLLWREHPAGMSAVPLGTAISAVIKRSSGDTGFAAVFAVSVSIVKENVHLIASVPLGSVVLQGRAAMKGTSWCNECGAIGYCYFSSDETKFRDTGFAAAFAVSVSMVKCCQNMLFVDRKMCVWSQVFQWEALCLQGHAGLGVVALRFALGSKIHRTCCKGFRGWGYRYFIIIFFLY